MASAEQLQHQFQEFEADWLELKPLLLTFLPQDASGVKEIEDLFTLTHRAFERASRAETRGHRWLAMGWYEWGQSCFRRGSRLSEVLAERAYQVQQEQRDEQRPEHRPGPNNAAA